VQIHFHSDRGHWVTSSTLRNRVEIADSLFNAKLSAAITNQLCQLYSYLAVDDILDINDSFEPFQKSVKRRRGRTVTRNIKLSLAGKT